MRNSVGPSLSAVSAAALALLWVSPVQALDATATVNYSGEYTSNTARTEDNEVSEWIHVPGLDFSLFQEGAQLEVDASYRLERRFHEEDVFDDESSETGSAAMLWHVLPERLDFTVRNTRTDSTLRSINAQTEDNRQTVSYTELGPTLRFRPRRSDEIQLEYLYTDVSVEETDTDSERQTGTLRYLTDLSPTSTLSLIGTYNTVDFDNPLAPDLDVTIGTLGYSRATANVTYSLAGGYNQTKREARDDVNGPVFDASLTWNATAVTVIDFAASHQITDRSSSLNSGTTGFIDEVDEDTDLNEVFAESIARISLSRPLGNNQLTVALIGNDEDYEDVPRDNRRYAASLSLSRDLTRRTSLRLSLEAGRRDFSDEGDEQDEYRGELRLTRVLTRRLGLTIAARYDERESDQPGRGYEEWTGIISLGYTLIGPGQR